MQPLKEITSSNRHKFQFSRTYAEKYEFLGGDMMCSAEYEIEPGLDYEAVADALRAMDSLDVID